MGLSPQVAGRLASCFCLQVSGMTRSMTGSKLVSVKVPLRVLQAIPRAHKGRSRFIIDALKEKIARGESTWEPRTERGRRLAALLKKGTDERGAPLDEAGSARELAERRGSSH